MAVYPKLCEEILASEQQTHYYLCKGKTENLNGIQETLLESLVDFQTFVGEPDGNQDCIFIIATSRDEDIIWIKLKTSNVIAPIDRDTLLDKLGYAMAL